MTQSRGIITNTGAQVSSTNNDEEISDFFISFSIYTRFALYSRPYKGNNTNNALNYLELDTKA